jgi:hypothetical protein
MKMAPGSSGGDKPGAGGCIRRTDQLHTSMCKRQAKPASKYVLRYQREGLTAAPQLCNSFPKQGTELAPGAPRLDRGEARSSPSSIGCAADAESAWGQRKTARVCFAAAAPASS